MFSREVQRQLEGYFSATGNNSTRSVNMAKGLLIMIQIILGSLAVVKGLWDNGFGAKVEALEEDWTQEPTSGFTRRWWKTAQAVFNIYVVVMKLPISTLYNLAVISENNEIVLSNGNPITPFRLYDLEACGDLGAKTIEQIAWMEPEKEI